MNSTSISNITMVGQVHSEQIEDLVAWLKLRISKERVDINVHFDLKRLDGNYLYVPIYVGGNKDAIAKARLMQKIEDEWNFGTARPDLRLLLIPTKD